MKHIVSYYAQQILLLCITYVWQSSYKFKYLKLVWFWAFTTIVTTMWQCLKATIRLLVACLMPGIFSCYFAWCDFPYCCEATPSFHAHQCHHLLLIHPSTFSHICWDHLCCVSRGATYCFHCSYLCDSYLPCSSMSSSPPHTSIHILPHLLRPSLHRLCFTWCHLLLSLQLSMWLLDSASTVQLHLSQVQGTPDSLHKSWSPRLEVRGLTLAGIEPRNCRTAVWHFNQLAQIWTRLYLPYHLILYPP